MKIETPEEKPLIMEKCICRSIHNAQILLKSHKNKGDVIFLDKQTFRECVNRPSTMSAKGYKKISLTFISRSEASSRKPLFLEYSNLFYSEDSILDRKSR
jgi:hypothetical protein